MHIVFFGTPEFAVPFFRALINESDIKILCVVTQTDKPAGRGKKITAPAVKVEAQKNNIPVYQFTTLKSYEAKQTLENTKADVYIVVAYGKIIPKQILDIPPKGSLNVHPSLLPKLRGPSPMQEAIKNGETETGVTIMLLDEGVDTGPILTQEKISISNKDTFTTLQSKVHQIGPKLLIKTLKQYLNGSYVAKPQNNDSATITHLLKREHGQIDWNQSSIEIERTVRAYNPWPGAWTIAKYNNNVIRIKILSAKSIDEITEKPIGTIIAKENKLFVSTGKGLLELIFVQPEGKARMPALSFLSGHGQIIGQVLESKNLDDSKK